MNDKTEYHNIALEEMKKAGWTAGFRKVDENRFVAYARKFGHTCVGEGDGELGAIKALSKSMQAMVKSLK